MRVLLLLLMSLSFVTQAAAQGMTWTRSAGMAGADFALTRGYAAVESNPANLFLEDSVAFSFGAALHGGRLLVTGAGIFELADIATSAGLGSSTLLANVPATGLRIDAVSEGVTANTLAGMLDIPDPSARADVPTMGFTYKHGGLVIRQQTVASATVSRELVDLAVNGFIPEKINEYAAKDTRFRSFSLTSMTFGLGKRFSPRIAGGFAARYLHGRKMVVARVFEPVIDVDAESLSAAVASIESRGGTGFSLDIGGTFELRPDLFASLSVQNLVQRMNWSEDLWVSQSTFDQDDIGATDMRTLLRRFTPTEFDAAGTTLEAYAASQDLFTEAFLPRSVRAGIGFRAPSGTEIQLTASKNWGPGALFAPRPDRLALGVEHSAAIALFRAGVALERGGSMQIAGGFGLNLAAFKVDLAAGWTRGTGGMAGIVHGLSGSMGIGFVFLGDRIE